MSLPPLAAATVERYRAAGAWQDLCLYEVIDRHAAEDPDREAAVDQTRRLSYAELVAESNALARFLIEELGVSDGEPVVVQSGNRVELGVAQLACARAGATFVPLSDAWREQELRHLLALSEAVVALVPGGERYDHLGAVAAMRSELPALRALASLDGGGDFELPAILSTAAEPVAARRDPNLARYTMVSSGTTAVPKISLWSDNDLWRFHSTWAEAVALNFKDRMVGLAPAGTGAIGYVYGVLFPLLAGATSILLERWDAAAALRLLAAERATIATAVPTQIVKLLQEPGAETAELPLLRVVTNAGAPMPADAAAQLERGWGCRIQTVYGATDGGVPLMTRIDDPAEKRRRTVGRPLPLTDLKLVDPAMAEVAAGEPGELLWRSPTKSFGYLNDPERTEQAFWGEGYYRSGDLGQADEDGYFRIVGRAKDMIIRGGQNISPLEIEEAVSRHPAVAEVAAVGVPDPVYGERACAVVALRDGAELELELEELLAFLAERGTAKFKLPERLAVVPELPKNASGKVSKEEVKQMIEGER